MQWGKDGLQPWERVPLLVVLCTYMLPHATGHMYSTVGPTRETHPTSGGAMYAATDSKGRLPICAAVIRNPEANSILSFHATQSFSGLRLPVVKCRGGKESLVTYVPDHKSV